MGCVTEHGVGFWHREGTCSWAAEREHLHWNCPVAGVVVDLLVGFEHASPGSEAFVVSFCCHFTLGVDRAIPFLTRMLHSGFHKTRLAWSSCQLQRCHVCKTC